MCRSTEYRMFAARERTPASVSVPAVPPSPLHLHISISPQYRGSPSPCNPRVQNMGSYYVMRKSHSKMQVLSTTLPFLPSVLPSSPSPSQYPSPSPSPSAYPALFHSRQQPLVASYPFAHCTLITRPRLLAALCSPAAVYPAIPLHHDGVPVSPAIIIVIIIIIVIPVCARAYPRPTRRASSQHCPHSGHAKPPH